MALLTSSIAREAMAGAAGSGGSPLIGKLMGPEVVASRVQSPNSFKEVPQLAALGKAGKLPPGVERIGQNPLVIRPVHSIGNNGGTWRCGFSGPADFWNGLRCGSGPNLALFWDYTGDKVVPNIAKGLFEARAILSYPVRVALNPFASTIGYLFPSTSSGSIRLVQPSTVSSCSAPMCRRAAARSVVAACLCRGSFDSHRSGGR